MKKTFLLLLLSSAVLFNFPKSASATSFISCDITYTCLGGYDYLVTLTLYRDCCCFYTPILQGACGVKFTSSAGSYMYDFPQIGSSVNIPTTSGINPTNCQNSSSTLFGTEKYVYQRQVFLAPSSNWVISFNPPCYPKIANNNIISQYWYVFATLNNVAAPCNSSPQFSNNPSYLVCNGQDFHYNHGANDPDGDSLVYSLINPYQGVSVSGVPIPVTYMPGYSGAYPLPSNPPLTVNTNTGDILMNCPYQFVASLAIKVEEWKRINGVPVLIGTVMRDFQMNVVNGCNNSIPVLAGINPAATHYNPNDTTYFMNVCLGDTINFNVYSYDAAAVPSQKDTMTWNFGIPDGSWTVTGNGTSNPTGHFHWVPKLKDVSNNPKCFTVTIKDDAFTYFGQQTYSYCFTINAPEAELYPPNDSLLCMGESYQIIAHADTIAAGYHWKVNGIQTSTPVTDSTFLINSTSLGAGIHVISCDIDYSIPNFYSRHGEVIINVFPPSNVSLTVVDPTITANANNATYQWLDCDNGFAIIPGQTSQSFTAIANGNYAVIIKQGRCSNDTSACVQITSAGCFAQFKLIPDTVVQQHYFAINYSVGLSPISYLWNWGDGNTSTGPYPSHTYATSGWYDICLTINDYAGCISSYCDSSYLTKGTNTIISVNVIPPGSISIDKSSNLSNISVYPNPANDKIIIDNLTMSNNMVISIYSVQGNLLHEQNLMDVKTEIDIRNFAKGLYFIRLTSNNIIVVKKVIKE